MNTDNDNIGAAATGANENTERFNHLWEDFLSIYKGNLLQLASSEEGLTATGAVNSLKEEKKTWASPSTIYGRWIMTLSKDEPRKGDRVLRILTEDLNVDPVSLPDEGKNTSIGAGVAGGATGAAAGYFLPRALGASTILSAAGSILGGAAVALGAIRFVNGRKTPAVQQAIEGYVSQLSHYHDRVIEVLNS